MYTLVLVGGTGQRFGLTVGLLNLLGVCELPERTVVLDAEGATGGHNAVTRNLDELVRWARVGPGIERVAPYPQLGHGGALTVESCVSPAGSELFPLCVRQEEATLPLDGGFYANPKLASVVFRAFREQPGNGLNALLGQHAANPKSTVVIAGSVAGGTGAGILREVARAYWDQGCRRIIGIVFTRYFHIESTAPSSDDLDRNARLGCQYLLRDDGRRWFDVLAFIGPPKASTALPKPNTEVGGAPHLFPGFLTAASLISDGGVHVLGKAENWRRARTPVAAAAPVGGGEAEKQVEPCVVLCGARNGNQYLKETDLEFPRSASEGTQPMVAPGDILRDGARLAALALNEWKGFDLRTASSPFAMLVRRKLGNALTTTLARIDRTGRLNRADVARLASALQGAGGAIDRAHAGLECLRAWVEQMGEPGNAGGLEKESAESTLLHERNWRECLEPGDKGQDQSPHPRFAAEWCRAVARKQWSERAASSRPGGDNAVMFPYTDRAVGATPAPGVFEPSEIRAENIILPDTVSDQAFPTPFGPALAFDTRLKADRAADHEVAETLWLALALGWLKLEMVDLARSVVPFDRLAAKIDDRSRFSGLLRVGSQSGIPSRFDDRIVGATHRECGLWPGVRQDSAEALQALRRAFTEEDRARARAVIALWASLVPNLPDPGEAGAPSWSKVIQRLLRGSPAPVDVDDVRTLGACLLNVKEGAGYRAQPIYLFAYDRHRRLKVDGYLAARAYDDTSLTPPGLEVRETAAETLCTGYLQWDGEGAPVAHPPAADVTQGRQKLRIDPAIVSALELRAETLSGAPSTQLPDLLWDRKERANYFEVPSSPAAGDSRLDVPNLGVVPGVHFHRERKRWIVWLPDQTYYKSSSVRRSPADERAIEVNGWVLRFPQNAEFLRIQDVLLTNLTALKNDDGSPDVLPALPLKRQYVDLAICDDAQPPARKEGDDLVCSLRLVGDVTLDGIRVPLAFVHEEGQLHVEVWPKIASPLWHRFWCAIETDETNLGAGVIADVYGRADAGHYSQIGQRTGAGYLSVKGRPRLLWLGTDARGGAYLLLGAAGPAPVRHSATIGIDFGTFRTTIAVNAVGAVPGTLNPQLSGFAVASEVIARQNSDTSSGAGGRITQELLPRLNERGDATNGSVARIVLPSAVRYAKDSVLGADPMPFVACGIPTQPSDARMREHRGLKWGSDPATVQARRAYLRAIVVLGVAEACARGATEVPIRFTFPLSMDSASLRSLQGDFKDAVDWVQTSVIQGIQLLEQPGVSESEAGMDYAGGAGTWMATLDLGGETLDLGLFAQQANGVQQRLAWDSVRLGGNLVTIGLAPRTGWDEAAIHWSVVLGRVTSSPQLIDDVERLQRLALEYAARFVAGAVMATGADQVKGRIELVLLGSGWRWNRMIAAAENDDFGPATFQREFFARFSERVDQLTGGQLQAELALNTHVLRSGREKDACALGVVLRHPANQEAQDSIRAPNGLDEGAEAHNGGEPTPPKHEWWKLIGSQIVFGAPEHVRPSPDFPDPFHPHLRLHGPLARLKGAESDQGRLRARIAQTSAPGGIRLRTAISVMYEVLREHWFPVQ